MRRRRLLVALAAVAGMSIVGVLCFPRDDLSTLKPFAADDDTSYEGYQLRFDGSQPAIFHRRMDLRGVSKAQVMSAVRRFVSRHRNWAEFDRGDWYFAGPRGSLDLFPSWGPQLTAVRISGDNDVGCWRLSVEGQMSTLDVWRERVEHIGSRPPIR
jgi:hypothetical protein